MKALYAIQAAAVLTSLLFAGILNAQQVGGQMPLPSHAAINATQQSSASTSQLGPVVPIGIALIAAIIVGFVAFGRRKRK